jgi:hypothetical protein
MLELKKHSRAGSIKYMGWFKEWVIGTLVMDVPAPLGKYAVAAIGSIFGGWAFAKSGSWLDAAQWEAFGLLFGWIAVRASEFLGEFIVRVLLWVLP